MKIVKSAATIGFLASMSCLAFVAMSNDAQAQIRQLKTVSPPAPVAPGAQPAEALARALQNRERTKKFHVLQSKSRNRTKQMFQQRQRAVDQTHELVNRNARTRNEIIRRMQK